MRKGRMNQGRQIMMTQTAKFTVASSVAGVLVLFCSGVCLCEARDQKSTLGELRLEGKHIERMALRRNDGHMEVFNNPGETVKLPAGQYLLQDIRLKGGYTRQTTMRRNNRVVISEGEPALLKVGGPLKQTISVRRQGSILQLAYSLTGVGGETYAAVRNAGKRPAFAIYKGEKKIGAGEFEFG